MIRRATRSGIVFVFLFCFFFIISSAADAAIDSQGAKRLQAVFEELLAQYEEMAKSNGATLVREGTLMVEKGETYYAVTLPNLSVKEPDGAHTDIGMISINAVPADKPGQWKMTMALPTPIIYYNDENRPALTIKTASQNFGGIWDESVKSFVKVNASYKNVDIRDHTNMVTISVPDARLTMDMTQNAPDLWTGPAVLTLSDLRFFAEHNGATLGIKETRIMSLVTDYSFKAMLNYQEKMAALAENYETGSDATVSSAHIAGLYNLRADFMGNAWNGYDFGIAVKDFVFKVPARKGQPGANIMLANGQFGFGMNGFRTGTVNLGLAFGYNGLGLSAAASSAYKDMIPDHMNLDLHVEKLPYNELVELGRTSVQGLSDAPQAGALVGMNAVMVLPQLLTKAQTTLALKDSVIGNPRYDIASNATMVANMNALKGMTGTANTRIYGLDYLIDTLSAAATNPETPQESVPNLQQAVASLTILKMVGQISKDAQNRDTRNYMLELNEKGQTLLNGTDLQTLMTSMQGAKQ